MPSRGLGRAARLLLPLGSPPCCTADSQRRVRAPRPRYRVAAYRCVSFPRCSQSSQSKRELSDIFAVSTQCTQSCTCTTVIGREHDSLRATQFATPSRSQQERFFACRETKNIHLTAKGERQVLPDINAPRVASVGMAGMDRLAARPQGRVVTRGGGAHLNWHACTTIRTSRWCFRSARQYDPSSLRTTAAHLKTSRNRRRS